MFNPYTLRIPATSLFIDLVDYCHNIRVLDPKSSRFNQLLLP